MPSFNLEITSVEHFDFDVFSITCTESIYRVIRELNEAMNLDFQLNDLLDYTHKEGEDFYFPVYTFMHEELNIEFNVLPNQTSFQPPYSKQQQQSIDLFGGDVEQTTKLIPELENADYFLLVKGDNRYLHTHTILKVLQSITSFPAVEEIALEKLKDKKAKGNLLF
jgi:hypothetical protein